MGDRIGVQLPLRIIYLSLTNHPGQLSLAIPPWVGAMSTGQRAVMLCNWGVKADMVLFAGNTVWSISERVRCVCVDALYKSMFTLLYFYFTVFIGPPGILWCERLVDLLIVRWCWLKLLLMCHHSHTCQSSWSPYHLHQPQQQLAKITSIMWR